MDQPMHRMVPSNPYDLEFPNQQYVVKSIMETYYTQCFL